MEKISTALQPFQISLADLTLDPENARTHGTRNLDAISRSLTRFGQQKPVVIDGTRVIAGNGTVMAARSLGWEKIAAVQQSGLSAEEIRAFAIADNKTAELAEWEYAHLSDILRELPEELRLDTGFSDYEIEPLLKADWSPPTPPEEEGRGSDMTKIAVTGDQLLVIHRAVEKVREQEEDETITDGRALELICADYLAGE